MCVCTANVRVCVTVHNKLYICVYVYLQQVVCVSGMAAVQRRSIVQFRLQLEYVHEWLQVWSKRQRAQVSSAEGGRGYCGWILFLMTRKLYIGLLVF
jgi:hypothetical protein